MSDISTGSGALDAVIEARIRAALKNIDFGSGDSAGGGEQWSSGLRMLEHDNTDLEVYLMRTGNLVELWAAGIVEKQADRINLPRGFVPILNAFESTPSSNMWVYGPALSFEPANESAVQDGRYSVNHRVIYHTLDPVPDVLPPLVELG